MARMPDEIKLVLEPRLSMGAVWRIALGVFIGLLWFDIYNLLTLHVLMRLNP